MPTKTAHNWSEKPGSYDTVGTEEFLHVDCGNDWGIPLVRRSPLVVIEPPEYLLDYKNAKALKPGHPGLEKAGIHFFIDDYRFEVLWNMPEKSLPPIQRFHTVCTPDFSLYTDWPNAVNAWNTYRNRWLGAYWQRHGVQRVIPTIGWSNKQSYEYCFLGVEKGSTVAVATLGILKDDTVAWRNFRDGYEQMIEHIEPELVLGYGPLPSWVHLYSPVRCYPTKWDILHPNKRMRENIYGMGEVKASGSFMPVPVELAEGEKMLYNREADRFYRENSPKSQPAAPTRKPGWAQSKIDLFDEPGL